MGQDRIGGSSGGSLGARLAELAQRRAEERARAAREEQARVRRQEQVRAMNATQASAGGNTQSRTGPAQPTSWFDRAPATSPNVAPTGGAGPASQTAVEAEQEIRASIADIRMEDGDDKKNATVVAARAVEEQLAQIDDHAQRMAVVQRLQPQLEELGEGLQYLTGDQTEEAIGHLTRAAEGLGTDGAPALTGPIGEGLHATIREDGDNLGELEDAIQHTVERGDGALFGATLGNALGASDPDLALLVHDATAAGIGTLAGRFTEASDAFATVEQEAAGFVFEFGDTLDPEQRGEAVQTVYDRHEEEQDAFNEASENLASTMSAVSLFPNFALGGSSQQLADVAATVRGHAERLAGSSAGQAAIADAVVDAGNGVSNFVTAAQSATGTLDGIADAVVRSVTARADQLVRAGDFAGAADLFRGVQQISPVLGVTDPEQLSGLTELLERQAEAPVPDAQFARRFSREAEDIGGLFGRNGDTVPDSVVRSLGLAVAGATLLRDASNLGTAEGQFRAIVSASELSAQVAPFIQAGGAAGALQRFGALSRAGLVLDAVDTIRAVQRGEYAQAGVNAVGLAGAILTTTSLGGPAGTAVGAVLSVAAIGGQFLLNHVRANRAEDHTEEDLQAFLRAGGLDDFQAEILRDVTHEAHRSIGRIFSQIGEERDASPREVLEWFTSSRENDGAQQRELVDQIEGLDRDDRGNFTDAAVEEAIRLIEDRFGAIPA